MKNILNLIFASAIGGALSLGAYIFFFDGSDRVSLVGDTTLPMTIPAKYETLNVSAAEKTDFTSIAEKSVNAVVHVKNLSVGSSESNSLLKFFYGDSYAKEGTRVVGAGSGVIISSDGYIITNNHVIKGAKKVEITLNNKVTYVAEIVGVDESTDIALLKIDVNDLPTLTIGDSDNLKVGEWVLAVGNPFNLTSTVTAGIVSAKARNIHLSNSNNRIESFIQTDAAVNPGNSGGALVNVRGELIGINTAISSQTGSYIGYSFAVPSNIAKKVIEDILEFGNVQRAYLGINFDELDGEKADNFGVSRSEGVIITRVIDQGAAQEAGLKKNDVIIKMDKVSISKFSDLQGFLGSRRPGDLVDVIVIRNEEEITIPVKLRNQFGKLEFGKTDFTSYYIGEVIPIPKGDANRFEINYGVKIEYLNNENLYQRYGIEKGDFILSIEDEKVSDASDIEHLLKKYQNKEYMVVEILTKKGKLGYIRLRQN